ncbi:hypothetical protein GCM10011613_31680 [Cellvibrio zantedeschiae]|uniref:DUF4488 domain-containing protein n=1 Tax=Cellvibrio zantedeschiae TaxID=1237077 RepID=A0ABQ3B8A9_9GAMM|nr:hypothetical protein [Cellvibrio zantedeschiae]GGY84416.1 hypothetical protein GCM10011613_31680 [Cellvibrio zantedeschiae]
MNNLKTLFLIVCFASTIAQAQPASGNFSGLENIVGMWKLTEPASEQEKNFRLNYHFISRDSALVEVYGDPARQTTETIFHRDGEKLLGTHYCARGNQPRLKASKLVGNTIEFNFQDITNLKDKNDPHMVRMKYTFIDKDHFKKEEVYWMAGKEESSTMSLIRVN